MAKSWDVEGLEPDRPLIEGVRKIIQTKFREAFFFREAVIANIDTEAVHDMRVSLRRLWAAMRIFSNCFDQDPEFEKLIRKTRKLARRLGDVRDLDVLIEMLQTKGQQQTQQQGQQQSQQEGQQESQQGLGEPRAIALGALIDNSQKRRARRHQELLEHLQRLEEEGFEEEFLRFYAPDYDSFLSIATIGSQATKS